MESIVIVHVGDQTYTHSFSSEERALETVRAWEIIALDEGKVDHAKKVLRPLIEAIEANAWDPKTRTIESPLEGGSPEKEEA